jgi:cytochrome c556
MVAAAERSPQQIVDDRIAGMKKLGGHVKAASEAGIDAAKSKPALAEAIKFAESIPTLFPKGTGIGDAGVTKSRALQEIWAKPADFKAAAEALVAALKAADAAVDSGDAAKIGPAFKGIGKGCGGCHTQFRGPETE